MIYRGPCFLAIICFGSTPTPFPLSRQQLVSLCQVSSCVAGRAYWREGEGGGRHGADDKKTWRSINHEILSAGAHMWNDNMIVRSLLYCRIGAFNFQNLIGFKLRLIDKWEQKTLYFLKSFWKCSIFEHMQILHSKLAKSTNDRKIFFFYEYISIRYKKHKVLCWFQVFDMAWK